MDADAYRRLKAADARAGVADPAAAVPAIKALRDSVTLAVPSKNIRSQLWRTFEYGKLDLLYEAGKRGDFSAYPPPEMLPNLTVFAAVSTTLSFLNSGTEISADAAGDADWGALLAQVQALVMMTVLQQSTFAAIAGMRTQTVPTIPEDFNADDVVAAREQF